MNQGLIVRGVIILAIVAIMALSAYPPEDNINLGLDLQGGMHLVLQVQTEDALKSETDQAMERVLERLRDEGVGSASAARPASASGSGEITSANLTRFQVTGVPSDKISVLRQVFEDFFQDAWTINTQSDGAMFSMLDIARQDFRTQSVDQAVRTIRNRIDQFGVSEPVIQRQGFSDSDRIVLQLPGVDDPERVKRLIKNTAFLEWRLMDFPREGGGVPTREMILENYGGQLPPDLEILEGVQQDVNGNTIGTQYYAVERRSVVTGRDLKNARLSAGSFNEPVVAFFLNYERGEEFGNITAANVGRGMAVVLDGNVLMAPRINSKISDSGIIEGNFSQEEAADLSTALRSGALPAGIVALEERTVGASLGQDSIDQGLRAGLFGGALVVLAMIVVYLLSGFNAVFVLSLNVVLVFGALASFGATLTLPGIAGIILTVGMAVDANVLIFERIREELRAGRTVKASIESGFANARSSVLDANITTLIAAIFLFQFGTGPIRGFAVTLSVGILASLFTAIFVSRWVFDMWLSRRQRVEHLSI